jgi:hypothetical protein
MGVEASAKDGAHNGSGGTNTMRVRYEVMRCEGGDRERYMAEGNKRRRQVMRYNGHILMEADVERSGTHGRW